MKAARTRALHRKHAGTSKHHSSAKHTPTAHRRGAAGHKQVSRRVHLTAKAAHARALSAGDVSCCSAEALAVSLRLSGVAVADADVLALYWHTAESAGAGASIVATLEAAYRFGLAGVRPVSFAPGFTVCSPWPADQRSDGGGIEGPGVTASHCGLYSHPATSPLILGLELPEGPHAVALDPSGDVWSWGGLYELGGEAVIEEAWAVTWP